MSSGTRYYHTISTGDFGPGLLQGPFTLIVARASFWVFTPLRWLEAAAWSAVPRAESVSYIPAEH